MAMVTWALASLQTEDTSPGYHMGHEAGIEGYLKGIVTASHKYYIDINLNEDWVMLQHPCIVTTEDF